MRLKHVTLGVLLATLASLPCLASIKAMSLAELMQETTDTVKVTILDKRSFRAGPPWQDEVFTRLTVEGESLRTGAPISTEVIFLGSHDPADNYTTTITPSVQDTRVGNEAVLFFYRDAAMPGMPGPVNRIFDLTGVYRVETAFGSSVVIGKGEGAPIAENVKLADLRVQVREIHLAQQAATGNGK